MWLMDKIYFRRNIFWWEGKPQLQPMRCHYPHEMRKQSIFKTAVNPTSTFIGLFRPRQTPAAYLSLASAVRCAAVVLLVLKYASIRPSAERSRGLRLETPARTFQGCKSPWIPSSTQKITPVWRRSQFASPNPSLLSLLTHPLGVLLCPALSLQRLLHTKAHSALVA